MPSNTIADLSREQLAQLGREYMATAQFNSRCGYAALRMNHGDESYKTVAIDNWMAASPVYTRRMQRAMGFAGGDDVATIFKGLQLECGFSHQYFNVRFEVFSPASGRFWLESCGALLETEPRGDEAVRTMCHDIEDPTFDATAIATNPRARVRPVHRPPRQPAERTPHCEWNVIIDASAEQLGEPDVAVELGQSRLAQLSLVRPERELESGGMQDYAGEVHEQLHLEQFSHAALVVVCQELALQVNLLIKGMTMIIEKLYGRTAAQKVAEFQMIGSGWVTGERLAKWAGVAGGGIDGILTVLGVHPLFQPQDYQPMVLEKHDDSHATLRLLPGIASEDNAQLGWQTLLQTGFGEGLEAIAKGVDPRARVAQDSTDEATWHISIDSSAAASEEPLAVQIAKGTVLYQKVFSNHVQLLQVQ
tara:strand:+ start:25091 stop:26350 length:1260 start_codon:yes stop_codon:yes gene_type:complete